MDTPVLPSKLLSNLSKAAEIIRSHDFIHVYSHYDADGLTAAAIAAKALTREGKEFSITIFTTLGESEMGIIENTESECVLVTDLGASYIKHFDAMECDVVVLDHHTVLDQAQRICYANPHLYGIDGMTSGCGASMAFLFAITLNEANWDLSPVAFAGLVGDRQHLNGLTGINTFICEGAVEKGFVKIVPGSLIPVGNLSTELFLSTDPYIRGVSGNSDGTARFLQEAGIAPNREYSSLTEEEALRLSSMIAVKLIDQGVTKDKLEECARTRYYLPTWGTDAETLSSVINSCGRQRREGLGIAVGMGDGKALEEAKYIDSESRKDVVDAVSAVVSSDALKELENIQWFDSTSSGFTGIICGVIMNYLANPEKPTIGINCSEPKANISSRATVPLLEKGVDLADAMRRGCAAVGGEGGGHKIAAGGAISRELRDEFLKTVDLIVGEQRKAHNKN